MRTALAALGGLLLVVVLVLALAQRAQAQAGTNASLVQALDRITAELKASRAELKNITQQLRAGVCD